MSLSSSDLYPLQTLDLRQMKCPLNFVKARLALEKLPMQGVLEIWIDAASESVLNIPNSMRAEGHGVLLQEALLDDPSGQRLWLQRQK